MSANAGSHQKIFLGFRQRRKLKFVLLVHSDVHSGADEPASRYRCFVAAGLAEQTLKFVLKLHMHVRHAASLTCVTWLRRCWPINTRSTGKEETATSRGHFGKCTAHTANTSQKSSLSGGTVQFVTSLRKLKRWSLCTHTGAATQFTKNNKTLEFSEPMEIW